jgi:hypothetical protein
LAAIETRQNLPASISRRYIAYFSGICLVGWQGILNNWSDRWSDPEDPDVSGCTLHGMYGKKKGKRNKRNVERERT